MPPSCPFCTVESERVFHAGEHVRGLWDAYPVNPGHALLVPKRHLETWFDASSEEQSELTRSIAIVRDHIERAHDPVGYNIGCDLGVAAGQTVNHSESPSPAHHPSLSG